MENTTENMFWWQITIPVNATQADELSDQLLEDDRVLAMTLSDQNADTPDEIAIYGEPGMTHSTAWQQTYLQLLVEAQEDVAAMKNQFAHQLTIDPDSITITQIPSQDWVRQTQQQFEPILFPPHLAIVSTWHETPQGFESIVQIDPGMAFGTGSHPTTQLCLEWLCAHKTMLQQPATTLIDYGCGSGILAIAAAKLGAKSVCGTDIDSNALLSAQDNAHANNVQVCIQSPEYFKNNNFHVVIANILANPLQLMAPMLSALVKPQGYLVLSGILTEQIELLQSCYAPWIALHAWGQKDGWVCLVGHATS